jgi:DNA modification methylase
MKINYSQKVVIGNATLYCADCQSLMPELPRFDALVTDPPYGIGKKLQGGANSKNWQALTKEMLDWDQFAPNDLVRLAVSKANFSIVWGGNYFELPPSRAFLVWAKGRTMYGRTFAECEQAWCSWDGNAKFIELSPPTHSTGKIVKVHPTEKPLRIMEWSLSKLPEKCESIFDPFMGSGTTGVAALQAGMSFVGIEKNQGYFDIACQKIEKSLVQKTFFEPRLESLQHDFINI